jgi:hypothetical protein
MSSEATLGVGGGRSPLFCVEPKKTGARSARARSAAKTL